MEYYAASYIASATPELKSKFYEAAVLKSHLYIEELHYLSYIDQDYYERNYLVPVARNVLKLMGFVDRHCNINCIAEEIELGFIVRKNKIGLRHINNFLNVEIPPIHSEITRRIVSALNNHIKNSIIFTDTGVIFPMDSSSAYYTDLRYYNININWLKRASINQLPNELLHFGCIINPYKDKSLRLSIERGIFEVCEKIHDELTVIERKLVLRDEKIKRIEF